MNDTAEGIAHLRNDFKRVYIRYININIPDIIENATEVDDFIGLI